MKCEGRYECEVWNLKEKYKSPRLLEARLKAINGIWLKDKKNKSLARDRE